MQQTKQPERIVVDGRVGLAVYLNDEFEPTTKKDCTKVKIVFDDGDILIGERTVE